MGVPPLCRVVGGDLLRRREGGTTLPLAFDPWSLHSGSVLSLKPIVQAPPPHLHILHLPSIVPRRVNVTRSPVLPNSRSLRSTPASPPDARRANRPPKQRCNTLASLPLCFARAVGRGCTLPARISAPVCYGARSMITCMQRRGSSVNSSTKLYTDAVQQRQHP